MLFGCEMKKKSQKQIGWMGVSESNCRQIIMYGIFATFLPPVQPGELHPPPTKFDDACTFLVMSTILQAIHFICGRTIAVTKKKKKKKPNGRKGNLQFKMNFKKK